MKKIAFISTQKEMIEDIETGFIMGITGNNYELICFQSLKDIKQNISALSPDLVVLSCDALITQKKWDFSGVPVATIACNKDDLSHCSKYPYPSYGIASTAEDVLDKLNYDPLPVVISDESKINKGSAVVTDINNNHFEENYEDEFAGELDEIGSEDSDPSTKSENNSNSSTALELLEDDDFMYSEQLDKKVIETPIQKSESNVTKKGYEIKNKNDSVSANESITREFLKDTKKIKPNARVITVYSAKGGVGKTTIATELATYLALINIGQRKLRVCIVDYNIDFGDVRSTIAMSADGPNMTYWTDEIQEFLQKGVAPEEIKYNKEEIENLLKRDKKSGLYVLPAPLSNEDSMGIESEALAIILDNLVNYGEFDYIICDTGNNTRDSTMIALEHADIILLVMTQNVNTANCDKAFIETMNSIDFDLSNTKLVINSIMPQKATSVSVQEIVDYFPYECVGKLKFNTDVIKAANLGEPLAFDPNHDFTKQMRNIVTYILQDNNFETEVKDSTKKRLFSFLFKKK